MADPNGSLLELRHINQIYGGGEQTFTAIRDVTLSLNEGEFATLMGPTGCGKSTLLRIITGLQVPTAGEVL
ncbi:MAG TPA: ATP-binding cassette domain-containing protein, partial [Desulfobaccales bacterium]|nr:ATP-binding cassette domain-containing protein [Desulfobaccales bacterium]